MNVLSLFDGMSCGRIALQELALPVTRYYASEIDKFAIQQSTLNFPETIHLGSVTEVDVSKLEPIDLLLGGSPCQSFSFAGKRKGMATKCEIEITTLEQYLTLKTAGFEFEGQSYLFWEYVRILRDIQKYNPGVKFLLENVKMSKKWEAVLSEAMGCSGIHINSALVSAQNRRRIYWTNIGGVGQPEDRGILLRDILEPEVDEKYYLSEKALDYLDRGKERGRDRSFISEGEDQATCLTSNYHKGVHNQGETYICVPMRGRNPDNPSDRTAGSPTEQRLEPCSDVGKTNCLTTVGKDNLVLTKRQEANLRQPDEKTNSLLATSWKGSQANGMTLVCTPSVRVRRLTPTECARLQTIPDWYRWSVSNTQQYRMLGNGWTVEVIKHILSYWWEGHCL